MTFASRVVFPTCLYSCSDCSWRKWHTSKYAHDLCEPCGVSYLFIFMLRLQLTQVTHHKIRPWSLRAVWCFLPVYLHAQTTADASDTPQNMPMIFARRVVFPTCLYSCSDYSWRMWHTTKYAHDLCTPCGVSHLFIFMLRLQLTHVTHHKICPWSLRAVWCFLPVYLHAQTAINASDIRTWPIAVILIMETQIPPIRAPCWEENGINSWIPSLHLWLSPYLSITFRDLLQELKQ